MCYSQSALVSVHTWRAFIGAALMTAETGRQVGTRSVGRLLSTF